MHNYWSEFLTIALVHFLAVASPGPDLAITLRQSITFGRRAGLFTALGIGAGISVHVAYCILGIGLIISQSIIAFTIIKLLGAAYLMYVGFMALRAKPGSLVRENKSEPILEKSPWGSFVSGFVTNALNPKATLFFLAVFTVVVNPSTPIVVQIGYGAWMIFATAIWFSSLSLLFTKAQVRACLQRMGHWFERCMGALLIALGLKLAFTRGS